MRKFYLFLIVGFAVLGVISVSKRLAYELHKVPQGESQISTHSRLDSQVNPRVVQCPQRAFVILAVGQSNAGNYGQGRREAKPNVVNFYHGQCYRASDPLLGASGDMGSFLTRLDLEGPVVIVPLGIGASRMGQWTPEGYLYDRIDLAEMQLAEIGLSTNISIVVQGESEGLSEDDPNQYARQALLLYRSLPGTVMVSNGSRCADTQPNDAIRTAQRQAAREAGAVLGPDIDVFLKAFGGCHLNDLELDVFAAEWSNAIANIRTTI